MRSSSDPPSNCLHGLAATTSAKALAVGIIAACFTMKAMAVTELHLIDLVAGRGVELALPIVNSGAQALKVESIETSCPCVEVVDRPETVASGASAEALLYFVPERVGPVRFKVKVRTDSIKEPVIEFEAFGFTTGEVDAERGAKKVISQTEAAKGLMEDRLVAVDVRTADDYQAARIPGSISLPIGAVGHSPVLIGKDVVLVGSGADDDELLATLDQRPAGRVKSVRVLAGGFRLWSTQGNAATIQGDADMQQATLDVSQVKSAGNRWAIFAAGAIGGPKQMFGAEVRGSDWDFDPRRFWKMAEKRLAGDIEATCVLVVSPLGEGYTALESSLPRDFPRPVFYLKGGSRAYHEMLVGAGSFGPVPSNGISTGSVRTAPDAHAPSGGCRSCPGK